MLQGPCVQKQNEYLAVIGSYLQFEYMITSPDGTCIDKDVSKKDFSQMIIKELKDFMVHDVQCWHKEQIAIHILVAVILECCSTVFFIRGFRRLNINYHSVLGGSIIRSWFGG